MSEPLPVSSRWWMDGFCWYARKMVRKQFHVFAVDSRELKTTSIPAASRLIVYANHPGWWDPVIGMLLNRELFPERAFYAPIDAKALKKYKAFRKLGYFGIHLESTKGAAEFLKKSAYVLESPAGSLWVTPEGRFTDPRDPSPDFMPGIAHLASKTKNVACLPLAIEYPFVEEQLPFILCRLGKPVFDNDLQGTDKAAWLTRLETELRSAQSSLSEAVIRRDWSGFTVLVRSKRKSHGKGFP